jgi:hypothetical protein
MGGEKNWTRLGALGSQYVKSARSDHRDLKICDPKMLEG